MANSSGVGAVCGALMAVVSVALGISGAAADDLVASEEIGASEADDAASMATDGGGRVLWSRQPGTNGFDFANGVATDKDGNVYVVGATFGALGGRNKGGADAFVLKFDGDGHRLWSRQPGTSNFDTATGVATDADGNVYVGRDRRRARRPEQGRRRRMGDQMRGDQINAAGVATDSSGLRRGATCIAMAYERPLFTCQSSRRN